MDSATPVDSSEELRGTLVELRRERDLLMLERVHAQQLLDALDSLLTVGSDDDPFRRVFAALRKVVSFSHALMLVEGGDSSSLDCIGAEPAFLIGSRWPAGPMFRNVMAGRVLALTSNVDVAEWRDAHALDLSTAQSALYVPVHARDRRGLLMLLRPVGSEA